MIMTSPLKRKVVLKLETEGDSGEPIVVERPIVAKWESVEPMLDTFSEVDDVEDFLKEVIKNAMVEFVEAEGKAMLTELIRKVTAAR